MKKLLIALAVLAAATTAAQAKCSTKSLNGSWTAFISSSNAAIVTINNGTVFGFGAPATVTMGKNCKGTMTVSGAPAPLKLTAERISPTSDLKPNTLVAVFMDGMSFSIFEFAPALERRSKAGATRLPPHFWAADFEAA